MAEKEHDLRLGEEHPHTHKIISISALIFLIIWVVDSFFFEFSTFLNNHVPLFVRIILFIILFIISLFLGISSHNDLFGEKQKKDELLKSGIFAHIRHPLYLSILIIYLGFIALSISVICIGFWLLIFILTDRMASYEEKDLERLYGDEYLEYKKKVPKWIPSLTPRR